MAKTYHKEPNGTVALKRGELVRIIGNACWFEEEWKHLYRTVIPSKRIESGVAEVADMVARGGAAVCRKIMSVAIAGLQHLERGEIGKADHALRICKRLIGADVTASKIVEKLVGNLEVDHG